MGKGASKAGGGGGGSLSSRILAAGSLTQAAKLAEGMGIHLDSSVLRDIDDKQLIKEGLAEIAWAKEEFPVLRGEDITLASDPDYKGAYMYSKTGSGTIAYAGMKNGDSMRRHAQYKMSAGLKDRNGLTDSPAGTELKHVVTHEMGHQVVRATCDEITTRMSGGAVKTSSGKTQRAYSDYVVQKAFDSVPKSERGRKGLAGMKKQISKYAYSGGSHETISEALADYRANGSRAKPLSKAIYNTLKTETSSAGIARMAAP